MSLSRKLSTDVALVGILRLAKMARSFLLIPIIVGTLNVSSYGAYAQVIALTTILTFIFSLGLQGALVRYAQAEDVDTSVLYLSVLLPALVAATVAGVGVFVFSAPISRLTLNTAAFETVFLAGAFLVPIRISFKIAESYYRSEMRTKFAAVVAAVRDYASVGGAVVPLYILQTDITGVVTGIVVVETAVTVVAQLVILRQVGISLPRLDVMQQALRYGLPLAGSNLSSNLSTRADRLIVGAVLGSEAIGVYDIAYRIASVVMIYSRPVNNAFFPEFSRLLEEEEYETCGRYVRNGVRYFTIFAIPSILGLSLINEQLIGFVTNPAVAMQTESLMPLLALGISIWGLDELYGVVLIANENTLLVLAIRGSAAILNVILNLVFVPMIGLLGAAIATSATYLLSLILVFRYSNRIAKSGIELGTVAKATFAAAIMYATIESVVVSHLPIILLIAPIIYFGIMMGIGGIHRGELKVLRSWL